MNDSVRSQIEEVQHMTVGALHKKYRAVFGEESRSNHKQFLIRRIAWRLAESGGAPTVGSRTIPAPTAKSARCFRISASAAAISSATIPTPPGPSVK
jgi:hypothetical protein